MSTIIKITISICLIIGTIFAYGTIVGGEITIFFYLIIIAISILTLLIIFGKKIFEKDKFFEIILIISLTCLISNGLYLFVNNNFDNEVIRSYSSVIIEEPGNEVFENDYYFKDPEGNIKYYAKYFIAIDFGNYNIGDAIYVEEYKGAFKLNHYKIYKQQSP